MMTTQLDPDVALKAKHRAMWALGDYPRLADDLIAELGPRLVAACAVGPGELVLDVAAGAGNAAIPAALAGARVEAIDLTPELLAAGEAAAAKRGASLRWRVGDAEALPYTDAQYDVVLSCVGIMFAPHHAIAAGELLRVCRSGGRIGVLSWTPQGFIGQMFAAMKPFAPPPPPGAHPPPLWGDEEHVRELLGDGLRGLIMGRERLRVAAFATPEALRDYFKATYGPTIAVYRAIAGDKDRVAELDAVLADLGRRHQDERGAMDWEYLLVTGERS